MNIEIKHIFIGKQNSHCVWSFSKIILHIQLANRTLLIRWVLVSNGSLCFLYGRSSKSSFNIHPTDRSEISNCFANFLDDTRLLHLNRFWTFSINYLLRITRGPTSRFWQINWTSLILHHLSIVLRSMTPFKWRIGLSSFFYLESNYKFL